MIINLKLKTKFNTKAIEIFKDEKDRRATLGMHATCLSILLLWFFSIYLLNIHGSFWTMLLSGFLLSSVQGVSHNFLHQPKTLWYYGIDFTSIPHDEWTIIHSISHHTYCNFEIDLEITGFEPFIYYLSCRKENHITVLVYQYFFFLIIPISPAIKIVVDIFRG